MRIVSATVTVVISAHALLRSPKPWTAGRRGAHEGMSSPSATRVSVNDGCNRSWPSLVARLVICSIHVVNISPASRYALVIHTSNEVDSIPDMIKKIVRRDGPSRHDTMKDRAASG
ncbi:uncharacterized protein LAESUDRAFT_765373 [Laetiporus sulphureus 93-53]|uniref:Uncharacterized protein n=1 Tax=Laetiporus sulphureus 93-53 TaxID=1314785 RepID=A0A165ASU0_9APHY|nr:uncharacterized protein LAESUDRAFT_765373 [Laetiporus sulphureus 93-53]KZS99592.1 hypothetical protein LAESUDRAFT_765373 [Laetiporus sulphureus 93-53]